MRRCWPLLLLLGCAGPEEIPLPPLDESSGDAGTREVPVVAAEEACAMRSTRAERGVAKQVDIIFVIDNSGSMTDEINAVRENINSNFAHIIEQSGVDYRVIMLSRFGSEGTNVCIEPPLASEDCDAGIWGAASDVYAHYDLEITSTDPFCKILESFDRPDPAQLTPYGWRQLLRMEADKVFVAITDDSPNCSYGRGESELRFGGLDADPYEQAVQFHEALLARSPEQFGIPPNIKYRWFSIVGMRAHDLASEPYFPHQAIEDERCDSAASPGETYQALSIVTDALRYPVCEGRGFEAVFQVLARNVVESAKAACVFEIPDAPPGQGIDLSTINVEYLPGNGGAAQRFSRVEERDDCDGASFVIGNDQIELCEQACRVVESDLSAEVNVHFACVISPE